MKEEIIERVLEKSENDRNPEIKPSSIQRKLQFRYYFSLFLLSCHIMF